MENQTILLFDKTVVYRAAVDSLLKLTPARQVKNPVMFVVWVAALLSSLFMGFELSQGRFSGFTLQITLWLWATLVFANFAVSLAEGRSRVLTEKLRRSRAKTLACRLTGDNREERVYSTELNPGDCVVCKAGDIIPGDGEIVEGVAGVDESAITGESAPVIRGIGGNRTAVIGGTKVLSDHLVIRITAAAGKAFLDKTIATAEKVERQKTPGETALTIALSALTLVFLLVVATLPVFAGYSAPAELNRLTIPVLVALLVCFIPTPIGGLLKAIGISAIDRLARHNVLVANGKAIDAAGDIDVLLVDKTGIITLGDHIATDFIPAPGIYTKHLAEVAQLASLADETPEGRSIVSLAKERYGLRGRAIADSGAKFIPIIAQTRMSGVDFPAQNRQIRKGTVDAIRSFVDSQGGFFPKAVENTISAVIFLGCIPLVVADGSQVLGVVQLKNVVDGGIKERFARLRQMGIHAVMSTDDDALIAADLVASAGMDDFIAQAMPQVKFDWIQQEQASGHQVAMIGDGVINTSALAQADVGVAMNIGTAGGEATGNMIDLDGNPIKLLEVIETGRRVQTTRNALTTFSIANGVAKCLIVLPALFTPLAALNIMALHSSQSAVLSAVMFNALIIIVLIPPALCGISSPAARTVTISRRNLILYGLGGLLAPFAGIKLLDMLLTLTGLA